MATNEAMHLDQKALGDSGKERSAQFDSTVRSSLEQRGVRKSLVIAIAFLHLGGRESLSAILGVSKSFSNVRLLFFSFFQGVLVGFVSPI